MRTICDALELPPLDPRVSYELQKTYYRKNQFGEDGRGQVIMTLRCLTESAGNEAALAEPIIVSAASDCVRRWGSRGVELLGALDHVPLVSILQTMRSLDIGSDKDIVRLYETSICNRLSRVLNPPKPQLEVKLKGPSKRQAEQEAASAARHAEIEKKLELGRRLLELRSKFRWGNEFGRQRRRLFDVDTLTACELMKVTRMYGGRPEIWQRLSWQALVQLSSPSLPAKHREEFERRIIAGEGVKGAGSMQAADRPAEGVADGGIAYSLASQSLQSSDGVTIQQR